MTDETNVRRVSLEFASREATTLMMHHTACH